MRIARFLIEGRTVAGKLENEHLHPFPHDSLENLTRVGKPLPIGTAPILTPCNPCKIVCIGLN